MNNDTTVNIGINARDTTSGAVNSAKEGFGGLWKSIAGGIVITNLAFTALDKLKSGITDSIQANKEWQTQQAITEGQLKLSGTAAGMTKNELVDMAEQIEKRTAVSREAALAGINQLLTFGGVTKDIMARSTDDVTRLASSMASGAIPTTQQMTDASKALGIALDDPSKGYTRLHRNGVDFTADQVAQMKAMQANGDLQGAQAILLKGIEDHYASLADKSKTWQFQEARLKETMDEFVGKSLTKAGQMLGDLFQWWLKHEAEIKRVADQIINFLKPNFEALMHTVEQMMPTLRTLWSDVLKPLAEVLGVAIVVSIKLLLIWWNFLLHAIMDLVQWGKNVGDTLVQAWRDIVGAWNAAYGFFANITGSIIGFFRNTWDTMRSDVKRLIDDIVNFFATLPSRAVAAIGNIGSRIGNDIKGALHAIHIPGFAGGVQNFSGGLAWVGENGPELVNLPRGSSVIPNNQVNNAFNSYGGNTQHVTIGQVILNSASAVQSFFGHLNQDSINVGRGLTPVQGAY